MQVPHGGLQGLVTHGGLDGPRVGSSLKGVRGISVSEFMGQDRQVELAPRDSDNCRINVRCHRHMLRKPKTLIAACLVVAVLIAIAVTNFIRSQSTSSTQAAINNLRQMEAAVALHDLEPERLHSAAEKFVSDRKAHGTSVPATVTFSELASGGYLSNREVATFSNAEVTVSLNVNQADPTAVWLRIDFADGFEMTQLANGEFTDGKYVSRWWK